MFPVTPSSLRASQPDSPPPGDVSSDEEGGLELVVPVVASVNATIVVKAQEGAGTEPSRILLQDRSGAVSTAQGSIIDLLGGTPAASAAAAAAGQDSAGADGPAAPFEKSPLVPRPVGRSSSLRSLLQGYDSARRKIADVVADADSATIPLAPLPVPSGMGSAVSDALVGPDAGRAPASRFHSAASETDTVEGDLFEPPAATETSPPAAAAAGTARPGSGLGGRSAPSPGSGGGTPSPRAAAAAADTAAAAAAAAPAAAAGAVPPSSSPARPAPPLPSLVTVTGPPSAGDGSSPRSVPSAASTPSISVMRPPRSPSQATPLVAALTRLRSGSDPRMIAPPALSPTALSQSSSPRGPLPRRPSADPQDTLDAMAAAAAAATATAPAGQRPAWSAASRGRALSAAGALSGPPSAAPPSVAPATGPSPELAMAAMTFVVGVPGSDVPVRVTAPVGSTAQHLIGVVLSQHRAEGRVPQLVPHSRAYLLRLCEEDGSIDTDAPPIIRSARVARLGHRFALELDPAYIGSSDGTGSVSASDSASGSLASSLVSAPELLFAADRGLVRPTRAGSILSSRTEPSPHVSPNVSPQAPEGKSPRPEVLFRVPGDGERRGSAPSQLQGDALARDGGSAKRG